MKRGEPTAQKEAPATEWRRDEYLAGGARGAALPSCRGRVRRGNLYPGELLPRDRPAAAARSRKGTRLASDNPLAPSRRMLVVITRS
jgi:hypothetical protein